MAITGRGDFGAVYHKSDLSNTAQDVGEAGKEQWVLGAMVFPGAADEIVIFRDSAGSVTHFRLPIPATVSSTAGESISTPVVLPFPVRCPGGLEVLTASAAGDIEIIVSYRAA